MDNPVPWRTLEALATQLAVITTANGYHTDIGASVRLNDWQRADSERPSIAVGSRTGQMNLKSEDDRKSPRARRMTLTVEAAMDAALEDEERAAHLMLEDIERALSLDTRTAPFSVRGIVFDSWSILDRPEGSAAVVLQLSGSAEYQRP